MVKTKDFDLGSSLPMLQETLRKLRSLFSTAMAFGVFSWRWHPEKSKERAKSTLAVTEIFMGTALHFDVKP